ncbi:unnamed protein product [Microthlaspi erraticum]|uniref:Uncharacterized protein n=1 Tax=Microthlaspi erraticum TaxID=1685480 RepID=A0A6D2HQ36_9BRAS|nr:unnamed protein product [Microthlaspi erraticum]
MLGLLRRLRVKTGFENIKSGFKTGFGSTAAFGQSVGTIGRMIESWPLLVRSERSWPDGFVVGRCGRSGEGLADAFSAGRGTWLPGSDGAIGRGTSFGAFWSIWDVRSMEDLAHGRSSTGYAKEEGGSHLEDQLDHLLDQPVEFLNSTGQASTRSS